MMEIKKSDPDKLYLFTTSFPYGTGETFLKDEIQILKDHFDEILVFPLIKKDKLQCELPGNVKTVDLFEYSEYNGLKTWFFHLFLFLRVFLAEYFSEKNKKGFRKRRKYLRSNLLQCIHTAVLLRKYMGGKQNKKVVYYSYWLHNWATILSLVKVKSKNFSFSARVHGYDLYAERHEYGIVPFRNFQLKNVSGLFTVSEDGKKYLGQKYPHFISKYRLSHLGVFDKGKNPFRKTGRYTLVSCSNCNEVKRVHLIAEALMYCKSEIHWVHFGDGTEMDRIKNTVNKFPDNIKAELMGRVENNVITEYYKNNPVDLFIHVSSTEGGVPVAIQEAVSFGIPVMAVAVGGVVDIVNERTGILIKSSDCFPETIAVKIEKALAREMNSLKFRENVRAEWEIEFSASVNYLKFCNQLKSESVNVI